MSIVDKLLASANLKPTISSGHNITVRILRIGPAEARALLKANQDNRALRQGRVNYYAKVMSQGGWRLTHQGIAFSSKGIGIDLQHRLEAVIVSGVTIDLMVTEGLDQSAFEAIDQHERRTVADALRIDKLLTEEAKFFLLCRGGTGASNPTVLEVGEASCLIEQMHKELIEACNTRKAVTSSTPMRAAAIVLMSEKPELAPQVLGNYRALVLSKSECWTPAMHAFNRQVERRKTRTLSNGKTASNIPDRIDLLTRGLMALDPTKASISSLNVTQNAADQAKERAARLLAPMGDEQDAQGAFTGNSF